MNNKTLSKSQLTQYTTLWCLEHGIKPRDLGCGTVITEDGTARPYQNAHPAIDDVIILIKLKEEFWNVWDKSERGIWSGFWSSAYHHGFAFKAKALKKIETLANSGTYKQQQQKLKQQKIRQLRESK
jgi:hypothetical protein